MGIPLLWALIACSFRLIAQEKTAPRLVTIETFCRELNISRSLFYSLLHGGRVRTVKIGDRRFIPSTEIERISASGAEEAVA